jgi:hypothetical protein
VETLRRKQIRMALELGVNLPVGADGSRSSTASAQTVLAASVAGVDDTLAADIMRARDWRHRYPEYFTRILVAEAQSGPAALQIARQGLAAARSHYVVVAGGRHPGAAALRSDAPGPGPADRRRQRSRRAGA